MYNDRDAVHGEVSLAEAAGLLRTTAAHVQRLIASGLLPSRDARSGPRVRIADARAYQGRWIGDTPRWMSSRPKSAALGLY